MNSLKQKTVNGIKWSAIERIVTQAVQLIIMLILGRMLGPNAFGLVGMLAIFIAISQNFVDGGFSSALIRKQDRSEADYATTLYFSTAVGSVCYLILFFSAPYISDFYQQPELIILARVLGINIILSSFTIVQRTRLTVLMDFKRQAIISLISVICSSLIALFLAYNQYGVWAIVFQSLSFNIINIVLLNIVNPWKPKCGFSKASFDVLFGFGSKVLAASLIGTFFDNIYKIIIGKLFISTDLGVFSLARTISSVPSITVINIIQRVTYPMFCSIQNDEDRLKLAYKKTMLISSLIVFPLMFGLAVISKPIVSLVLGEQWKSTSNLLFILCIGAMIFPIKSINSNFLYVKGLPGKILKLEIITRIITLVILAISINFGLEYICIGISIDAYLSFFIYGHISGKISKVFLTEQIKIIFPILIVTIISGLFGQYMFSSCENYIVNILGTLLISLIVYVILILFIVNRLNLTSIFQRI
ncbi:Teichuronic acid biosynthesis protein TuaB [Photobacterium malacitanum]|uniref:Teichuronic acid biosynthesis protein TuaB n=1 Tax=Photobacterium malacitanum TaxID=2204294 RepID=A0A1Y6MQL3_9GAMM|nr:lipopolysaccharide biosynthesis protein [Photobacterium malacitanum]SMY38169.1 Teichuronic acid biosynthesis protein TuaB [Photobacterium malacitanum]